MQRGLILTAGTARGNVDLAQRAERAGFDSVFSVEFFNQHAFAVLGAIAATTERIRIGTGIANAFTRAPLVHATAAMDLDELSGGRMVLGLGSGTRRMNVDWWGVPFEQAGGAHARADRAAARRLRRRQRLRLPLQGPVLGPQDPRLHAARARAPTCRSGSRR